MSSLKLQDFISNQCNHRQGLGSVHFRSWGDAYSRSRRNMVQVTWPELWRLEPYCSSLLLRSVYDTLPSPSHLHTWGLREDQLCKLCSQKETLAHILSRFKTALTQWWYRWHQDKVLLSLADTIERKRGKERSAGKVTRRAVSFLKEEARPNKTTRTEFNILQPASSWEMSVDVRRRL